MGQTVSRHEVRKTVEANEEAIRAASKDRQRLREERRRLGAIIARARRTLERVARRNGAH